MTKHRMAYGLLTFAACSIACAQPRWSSPVPLNIDAQPVDQAIAAWAQQTGYQVLVPAERSATAHLTPTISGTYTPKEGLALLIGSLGFEYQLVNADTVAIRVAETTTQANSSNSTRETAQTGAHGADRSGGQQGGPLAEVIVSAQKRDERLQDVPVPVSVINAQSLITNNQVRLKDYFSTVPGLVLMSTGEQPLLAIRGVTTGPLTNPTVGITVDDVPYGSSTALGGGSTAPDVDPSELSRVEVLRGPQGTLYGVDSLGGLLKYVTVDPTTDGFSGRVQMDGGRIFNGDGASYGVRGAANIPISETLGIRLSGFTRRDAGYIDNPTRNVNGVNKTDVHGGRVSALWRPSDVFSLKLSAMLERTEADGRAVVGVDADNNPVEGDLDQQKLLPEPSTIDKKVFSGVATASLGELQLESLTGYSENAHDTLQDFSFLGFLSDIAFGTTGSGVSLVDRNTTYKFTQELRLSGPTDQRFEWRVGAFYTHERNASHENMFALDPATLAQIGVFQGAEWPTSFEEFALFADGTVHFTDQLSLQLGARESQNRQTYEEHDYGPFQQIALGVPDVVNPLQHTKDTAFTYLATPQYRFSADAMLYIRLASGYRHGGPNSDAVALGAPLTFKPDKTQNYEIGFKGDLLNHAVSVDASIYYINWKDIQLAVLTPLEVQYFTNASRAKSQGIELSAEARPREGLKISGWIAWNDASLEEAFPLNSTVAGEPGDRLPFSAKFSANLSVEDEFHVSGALRGFIGLSASYLGARQDVFTTADTPRRVFPSYTQLNGTAGVRNDTWLVNAFINNATDRRGIVGFSLDHVAIIQPRTVGLSLAKSF